MKYLIVTDIHGNLPALEAVLADPRARACGRVLSLGDHTGFGPQPREVHDRLLSLGAVLLLGNHEERLPLALTAAYAGYNWALLRWTRAQMAGAELPTQTDLRLGPVWLTHGAPGNPERLLYPEDLPAVLSALPAAVRLLISGHNHTAWRVTSGGRTACNPGATGLAEDGRGGNAPFAVLDDAGGPSVACCATPYDVSAVRRAYTASGCAAAAPEICRAALQTMESGDLQPVLRLMALARDNAACSGRSPGDPAVLRDAAAAYPWRERISCADYWKGLRP